MTESTDRIQYHFNLLRYNVLQEIEREENPKKKSELRHELNNLLLHYNSLCRILGFKPDYNLPPTPPEANTK